MHDAPIVIFDSGLGGTSILREIIIRLPSENIIYLADSINAPYGEKPKSEIIRLSQKNTDLALQFGAKIIVVACNTATTNAIYVLRKTYNVPFVGIEPAIKPAALNTKTKRIGILATKGTLSSELFQHTSQTFAKDTKVVEVIGKNIVEAVESGTLDNPIFIESLKKQVQIFIDENIDVLVLGCTHYPYIIPILKQLLPETIKIIDSGYAVAKQTENVLKAKNLKNTSEKIGSLKIFTNKLNQSIIQKLNPNFDLENIIFKEF
ncbi:glutamate racemase [Psychroflexus aestuariivivens]|uniref:glutamate racemase n=1 Tax=Psychroflexus aestuariivivens TaxID=1795040 RepID=UPI000FD94C5A|nr:glutamate racemase [Psychroflexus aestuariivivens]